MPLAPVLDELPTEINLTDGRVSITH